jgi:hypothetical protein
MHKSKTKNTSNKPSNEKNIIAEDKRLRLANALRDNLSKRKQQARGRAISTANNLKDYKN